VVGLTAEVSDAEEPEGRFQPLQVRWQSAKPTDSLAAASSAFPAQSETRFRIVRYEIRGARTFLARSPHERFEATVTGGSWKSLWRPERALRVLPPRQVGSSHIALRGYRNTLLQTNLSKPLLRPVTVSAARHVPLNADCGCRSAARARVLQSTGRGHTTALSPPSLSLHLCKPPASASCLVSAGPGKASKASGTVSKRQGHHVRTP